MSQNQGSENGSMVGFPREKETFGASVKYGFSPRTQRVENVGSPSFRPLEPSSPRFEEHHWPQPNQSHDDRGMVHDACLMAGGLVGQAVQIGTTAVLAPVVGTGVAYIIP